MDRRNILFIILVILIAGIAVYQYSIPPTFNGTQIDPPKQMPDFTLPSLNGSTQLSSFRGKITVIFFGFTNCMDICPATLAKLNVALDKLGENANDVRVVFISVDHQRDTPETVATYASKFRPDFIGLTGTQTEIDSVTKDYGIYYKLGTPDANGDYEVEHTAAVMVLDRQGRLEMTWSTDQQPAEIAADLTFLLK